jgi:type I restriction enzyme S subunit
MSSEWRTVRVGDLGRIVTGKTPRTTIKENFGGKIPFLTPSDDMSAKYVRKTKRTLSEQGVAEVAGKVLPANSIAVSCIGSNLGKVTITTTETVTNQQINSIIPFESYYDTDFVYYAIKILGERLNFLSKTSTAVPIINKTQFSNETIRVPPLPIQKAISGMLACLDAKIEINNRITANLEQQAQAIFKNWFVDFEPFKDGEFIDSPLGLIPKGWKVEKLEDLVNIKYGKDHRSLPDGDIPVYGSGGLIRYISEAIYTSESVLIPRKGTLNNVMLVNHPFWSVDTMFYTEINKPNFAKFLFQLLKRKDLASMNVGSAVPSMTVALLNQIRFVLPPDEILEQFERVTNPFYLKIENNRRQNQILAALRDTLLPKLMSGEIEVPVV